MKLRIGKTSEFKIGDIKYFKYGLWQGILICDADGFHAFKNFCTHMGGPVRKCDDCTFKCEWHDSKFNMKTGKALPGGQAPEGTGLPIINVFEEDGVMMCEYEPPKDPFDM